MPRRGGQIQSKMFMDDKRESCKASRRRKPEFSSSNTQLKAMKSREQKGNVSIRVSGGNIIS